MSNAPTNVRTDEPATNRSDDQAPVLDVDVLTGAIRRTVIAPLEFVGFWAAVALPFLYLPLVYGGFEGNEATVFLGLLALNVLGLVVGRSYRRD